MKSSKEGKMKRLLFIFLAAVMALSISAPVFADDTDVTTGVSVSEGGGSIPIVKCKWEQEPITELESGDPTHATPGTQVNPPLVHMTTKPIDYFAVVTDEEDQGNVSQVFVDVYHPLGSPEPYGPSVLGGVQNLPYFKYEIPFGKLGHEAAQRALVTAAYEAGLITFGPDYDLAEVIFEMEKGTADLWCGTAVIDFEQPAGNYDVYAYAVDFNNNLSATVWNQFLYVPICGIEVDFSSISYGPVNLGIEKMIAGDTIWNTLGPAGAGEPNKATVRNIGNTWASVTYMSDDMGFGQDVTGMWNVNFDLRMGNDDAYAIRPIMPFETVTLVNALALSSQEELDFSIKIIKGFGGHDGNMTLGCICRPFDYTGGPVVGVPSHP
jgi:hypothetical protein